MCVSLDTSVKRPGRDSNEVAAMRLAGVFKVRVKLERDGDTPALIYCAPFATNFALALNGENKRKDRLINSTLGVNLTVSALVS